MEFESVFIAILIILVLAVIVIRFRSRSAPTRHLTHDQQGRLVSIGGYTRSEGKLTGSGSLTSAPLELAAGSYRIDYQFGALTRLALLDATSEETLIIKRDTGTEPLEILESGRYRFLVEPTDDSAAWTLAYRQLTDAGGIREPDEDSGWASDDFALR